MSHTPIAPFNLKDVYCLDLASAMVHPYVVQSLEAPAAWNTLKQECVVSSNITSKIDRHCEGHQDSQSSIDNDLIRVCQYNVQTFLDKGDQQIVYGELKRAGIAIACFQETREKHDGVLSRHDFICCNFPASNGSRGCEVASCV